MAPLRPASTVFAVNSSGRVLSLAREESTWRELEYQGLEFKRVSAAGNVLWAIGGDHEVYVYVYGLEVPILVKEATFENERWNPMNGFTDQLLPTDRAHWSSMDGTRERRQDMVDLPSMAWAWDDDWHIDQVLGGHHLPLGGWTYAVDFPADYHPKKGFTSCVRRRRWIRHRRYMAVKAWSAVPGLSRDHEEPIIDVSVGGEELEEGEYRVWAVTVGGRVVTRQGVTATCPEGTGWLSVPTPVGREVSQLSVAPSGLVWAVTWGGGALVRVGVGRLEPGGLAWVEVEQPGPEAPLTMVTVGRGVVWAVTRGGQVWMRQGVRTESSSEQLARGTRWVGMVGRAAVLALARDDGLLALSTEGDRPLVVRTGVSSQDLSGKTWRTLCCGQEGGRGVPRSR